MEEKEEEKKKEQQKREEEKNPHIYSVVRPAQSWENVPDPLTKPNRAAWRVGLLLPSTTTVFLLSGNLSDFNSPLHITTK